MNNFNFFRLGNAGAAAIPPPRAFRTDIPCPYRLPLVFGESYSYMLNSPYNGVPSRLHLLNMAGQSVMNWPIILQNLTDGLYLLGSYAIAAGTPAGDYYLSVTPGSTAGATPVRVITDPDYVRYTAFLEVSNPVDTYGYPFTLIGDYTLTQRVDISLMANQPETNKTQYRSTTTGRLRNLRSTQDWVQKWQTLDFDDVSHQAMTAWLEFDSIKINGKPVTVKTPYKINELLKESISSGEVEVFDQAYSVISRYGN